LEKSDDVLPRFNWPGEGVFAVGNGYGGVEKGKREFVINVEIVCLKKWGDGVEKRAHGGKDGLELSPELG
jgi:hypothetical protein